MKIYSFLPNGYLIVLWRCFFNNLDQATIQQPIFVTCLTLRGHEGGLFHANSSYMYLDLVLILTS